MLITFSKDYLSGEGDIIKHLSYLDYSVSQKQTILDEFDYAVTSISSDLRCGLRLTKVAELVTGGLTDLSRQLRVPTVSRLQKIHNTEVALKHLKSANPNIPDNISAKDVCDGHREKTWSLLWNIIFGFQLNEILDEDKLRSEILHLRKSLRLRVRIGDKVAVKGAKFIEDLKSRLFRIYLL
jgi:abnormal spindle-like microcephaly-associated protein